MLVAHVATDCSLRMTKTQPSDPIQVRTYTGASPAEAAGRYQDDAREAAQRGYRPSIPRSSRKAFSRPIESR